MRPGSLPIAISAVLAAIAFAQSQSPIQLEPEKTLNRDLAGGADLFALDLKTDQIVQLTLEGEGKDVILSVYSPDGRRRAKWNLESCVKCIPRSRQWGHIPPTTNPAKM
jgi:hypothetical protein